LNIGMKVLNEAGKTPKLPLGKSLREDVHLAGIAHSCPGWRLKNYRPLPVLLSWDGPLGPPLGPGGPRKITPSGGGPGVSSARPPGGKPARSLPVSGSIVPGTDGFKSAGAKIIIRDGAAAGRTGVGQVDH